MKKERINQSDMLRQVLGVMGMALPIVDWFFAVFFGGHHFLLPSISSTAYMNSGILFETLVAATGLFLICYTGYDSTDYWLSTASGIGALLLVFFPCSYDAPVRNFALLPMSITNPIHLIGAMVFFGCLFWMLEFQFTKSAPGKDLTKAKVKRNRLYKVCGWVMLGGLIFGFGGARLFNIPWFVYLGETIALEAFGIGWIVKGSMIIKDKE